MPVIPIINKDHTELLAYLDEKIHDPKAQRRLVLIIVCVALLLDNMLYMVIVPIIPDYLRTINAWGSSETDGGLHMENVSNTYYTLYNDTHNFTHTNYTLTPKRTLLLPVYDGEDAAVGVLFASKAIIQLLINPFSGTIIDRVGYDMPMMFGLVVIFFSTAIFAFGESYGVLFFARSLQGVGSAFADPAGLAMIADRFTEEQERSRALGIALAFISFGSLVAPPFGGVLYQFAGKRVPFIFLAFIALVDGICLLFVMKPVRKERKETQHERPAATPIYRLLMDPFIAVAAGALAMSNVSLAFLEPTIAIWMKKTMDASEWEMGLIWLPAFFPHVFGVYLTVKLVRKYPQYQWLIAAIGLTIEGTFCLMIPFASHFMVLMIPICGICFGIALVDTALLPTLGYLVDIRYVSVYGSVYAIADISYNLAYAFGPIFASGIVASIGYTFLNIFIFLTNVLYAPLLVVLRKINMYKPFEEEDEDAGIVQDTPVSKYKTYQMTDINGGGPTEVGDEKMNHLEYSQPPQENQGGYQYEQGQGGGMANGRPQWQETNAQYQQQGNNFYQGYN